MSKLKLLLLKIKAKLTIMWFQIVYYVTTPKAKREEDKKKSDEMVANLNEAINKRIPKEEWNKTPQNRKDEVITEALYEMVEKIQSKNTQDR